MTYGAGARGFRGRDSTDASMAGGQMPLEQRMAGKTEPGVGDPPASDGAAGAV